MHALYLLLEAAGYFYLIVLIGRFVGMNQIEDE